MEMPSRFFQKPAGSSFPFGPRGTGKTTFPDCGVFHSVRPMGPLDRDEEAEGAAVDTYFALCQKYGKTRLGLDW